MTDPLAPAIQMAQRLVNEARGKRANLYNENDISFLEGKLEGFKQAANIINTQKPE
jgi:hypothetical protein